MTTAIQFAPLALTVSWGYPQLRRDLDTLVRCGRVQEAARREGKDTPAGWWARASRCYPASADVYRDSVPPAQRVDLCLNRLGRLTCEIVSAALASGVPS